MEFMIHVGRFWTEIYTPPVSLLFDQPTDCTQYASLHDTRYKIFITNFRSTYEAYKDKAYIIMAKTKHNHGKNSK